LFSESIKAKQDFMADRANLDAIGLAAQTLIESLKAGGKVLLFGNGGSAADCQHFAAELIVRFEKERRSLPAIALTTDTSILTAAGNDYDFDSVFSRQIEGLGADKDVAIAISTSGMSPNVLRGASIARKKGMPVIALSGRDGGELAAIADIAIIANHPVTARIQEVHGTVIHILCKLVEDAFA